MKVSVLVPTWRRPGKLKQALESLTEQEYAPDQVVVVYRDVDPESLAVASNFKDRLPLTITEVSKSGVIHAENTAMKQACGDIICFMDDDAKAPKHWLKSIQHHFVSDQNLAGVGGPDFILHHSDPNYRRTVDTVGKLTWYGKVIGNHHHTTQGIQTVDVLKGVNMSFRKDYLKPLDTNLQSDHSVGNGSHWELDLCFEVRKAGGKLIFDPNLDIIHDSNHDHFVKYENLKNNARNLTYVMLKHLSFSRRISFLSYVIILGNEQLWGFGKLLSLLLKGRFLVGLKSYYYSNVGLINGLRLFFDKSS